MLKDGWQRVNIRPIKMQWQKSASMISTSGAVPGPGSIVEPAEVLTVAWSYGWSTLVGWRTSGASRIRKGFIWWSCSQSEPPELQNRFIDPEGFVFYPLETFQDGDDVSGQNRSGIRVGCWLLVGPRLDGEIGIFIKFGLSLVDWLLGLIDQMCGWSMIEWGLVKTQRVLGSTQGRIWVVLVRRRRSEPGSGRD